MKPLTNASAYGQISGRVVRRAVRIISARKANARETETFW
jgi:uncharacterized DUF497 family protein